MAVVYLGLGSNEQPEQNLKLGVGELSRRFTLTSVSRVYRSKSLGFEGDDFLNAVVCVETGVPIAAVVAEIDAIHNLAGRRRGGSRFVSRTLDIDLLLYDNDVISEYRVPRVDVLEYSFVLRPLAEIAPDLVHPATGNTMAEHWAEFDKSAHPLTEDSLILLNDRQ